jgi:hypothetical protein
MPSQKAILRDIHDLGLDHHVAHSQIRANGRLTHTHINSKIIEQIIECVENNVTVEPSVEQLVENVVTDTQSIEFEQLVDTQQSTDVSLVVHEQQEQNIEPPVEVATEVKIKKERKNKKAKFGN